MDSTLTTIDKGSIATNEQSLLAGKPTGIVFVLKRSVMQNNPLDRRERQLSRDNHTLSFLIAMQIGAVFGHCYENAYPAFFACPALFEPDGLFVEGWIVFEESNQVILMEHGWLLSNNGRIIDPTIALAIAPGQPVYYFPGVVRTRAELETLENEFFPHVRFESYGDDGMGHADYHAAYEAAQEKAKFLLTEGKTFREVRATMMEAQSAPALMIFLVEQEHE
jgi:hypothetical protein